MTDEPQVPATEERTVVVRPGWYWWLAVLASSLTTSAIALGLGVRANAESDRKWCSVVATLDDAYRETPPATIAGKNLAGSIAELRGGLGCPPG